ncbi:8574_t:CDS:2 [Dentiscutata erythropus]|uniref:8574_t:CDS:1 n=1 Tax=Dentiscutata erythropus TaxID=1348616 RepID=A0A9N9ER36_9GLOM|nr:8574_t:CDS:2 [Dentiscutata erythropus]
MSTTNKKSRRGRKAYITPEKTDTTGQCHFMIVRRVTDIAKNKKKNNFSRMDTDSLIKFTERFVPSTTCDQNDAIINQNIAPQYFNPVPFDIRSFQYYQD